MEYGTCQVVLRLEPVIIMAAKFADSQLSCWISHIKTLINLVSQAWRHISPATWPFKPFFFQDNNKVISSRHSTGLLWRCKSTDGWWTPVKKGQLIGKTFHVTTPSRDQVGWIVSERYGFWALQESWRPILIKQWRVAVCDYAYMAVLIILKTITDERLSLSVTFQHIHILR